MFAATTGVNPLSLKITHDHEYFLFMELRAAHAWRTHGMNSHKYAACTKVYNSALEKACHQRGFPFVPKHPRALHEKLAEIEPKILSRILRQDFKCEHILFCFLGDILKIP